MRKLAIVTVAGLAMAMFAAPAASATTTGDISTEATWYAIKTDKHLEYDKYKFTISKNGTAKVNITSRAHNKPVQLRLITCTSTTKGLTGWVTMKSKADYTLVKKFTKATCFRVQAKPSQAGQIRGWVVRK
jgi:type 1 fimbria pilin